MAEQLQKRLKLNSCGALWPDVFGLFECECDCNRIKMSV